MRLQQMGGKPVVIPHLLHHHVISGGVIRALPFDIQLRRCRRPIWQPLLPPPVRRGPPQRVLDVSWDAVGCILVRLEVLHDIQHSACREEMAVTRLHECGGQKTNRLASFLRKLPEQVHEPVLVCFTCVSMPQYSPSGRFSTTSDLMPSSSSMSLGIISRSAAPRSSENRDWPFSGSWLQICRNQTSAKPWIQVIGLCCR